MGEIMVFAGTQPPSGWAFCSGQLLPINQNQALFALLGTTYGGNGQTNFALPDLSGRAIVGTTPDGLGGTDIGTVYGSDTIALTVDNIPSVSVNDGEFGLTINGANESDLLRGNGGDDTVIARGGNDYVNGGNGDDSLDGGDGNDTAAYDGASGGVSVSLALAGAQGTGGSGIDTLTNIENLVGSSWDDVLTGDGNGNSLSGGVGNDQLYGLGGNDSLFGEAGNDVIDGGGGADTMVGGTGNDNYYVNQGDDLVIEAAGQGEDRVLTRVSYTLAPGVSVEVLGFVNQISTAALNLTGNEFRQLIVGNAGNNILSGAGGDDELSGGGGTDTLIGGTGNDVFRVDDPTDIISENMPAKATTWSA